jgi:hypothetical protein
MPIETEMLVDRLAARSATRKPFDTLAMAQGTCLVLVECTGFAASTLLLVLGLPLFAFLALAGWDLGLLFAQLGNLAEHYRSAGPAARHLFASDLQIGFLVAAGGLFLLRLPAFLRRLDRRLAEGARSHD